MKSFMSSLRKLDLSVEMLRDRIDSSRQYPLFKTLLLSSSIIGSSIGLMAGDASAAPLNSTDIYVNYSTNSAAINQIRTISPSGVLSNNLFTTGVGNTAALGIDPISLQLYYSDRTLTPNNLRRYDGTTESLSLGTFAGSTSGIPMVRMGFRGSVGYGISNDNTVYTFTTDSPTSTITSLGTMSFLGTSPSGVASSGDIAFDGYGFGWAIFGNSLYRINLKGGVREAIPIGQITVGGSVLPVPDANGTGIIVGSIAFDSVGNLYIAGLNSVANVLKGTNIYKVDVNNATAVQVGSTLNGGFITDMASGNQPNIAPIVTATKSVSPTGLAMPGDTLTYTIEVENTGTAPAVNLDFTDVLPASTTYVANSATLNGVAISGATYPFSTATRINGRTSSAGSLKVGYANRATITFKVTVNTTNVPSSIVNQGTIVYLDSPTSSTNPTGSIPTSTAATTVTSPVTGYKSVKLTNDADSSGSITPGDTVTWTISYKNQSTIAVNSFQINDPLPTGVTLTPTGGQTVAVSGTGTSATKNTAYTGASTGAVSNLLNTATLNAGGVVTVNIPTVVTSGFTGTLSNQSNATGSSIPGTGTLTDNVDNTTSVPAGVTIPTGSIIQTQTTAIDSTTATVTTPSAPVIPSICSVAGGIRGTNLFANDGNFGTGSSTPSTSTSLPPGRTNYNFQAYGSLSPTDGSYAIVNQLTLNTYSGNWHNTVGHTTGTVSDQMMVVNAAATPGTFYTETLTVPANQNIEFSAWILNLLKPAGIKPNISFVINRIGVDDNNNGVIDEPGEGQVITNSGPIPETTTPTWVNYGAIINTGNSTQIEYRLVNNAPGGNGNDLVLDDLFAAPCSPMPQGNITGTLYRDTNNNNIYNSGTDATMPANIAVNLKSATGAIVATAYTDASGNYNFTNVPTGNNYTIEVALADTDIPNGVTATANPTGANTTGQQSGITVTNGATLANQNFGFRKPISKAKLLLVKRITAINGDRVKNPNDLTKPLDRVLDNPDTTNDNNPNWPNGLLIGAYDAGKIKPGDKIEYTVYFMNANGADVSNVKMCDPIIGSQTFLNDAYGAGKDIQYKFGSNPEVSLTRGVDPAIDRAQLNPSTGTVSGCTASALTGTNNGTVVIDVTGSGSSIQNNPNTIAGATGPSTPNSYGYFRFTTQVNPPPLVTPP